MVVTCGEGGRLVVVEATGAAEQLKRHRKAPPTKNYLVQNLSSAEV